MKQHRLFRIVFCFVLALAMMPGVALARTPEPQQTVRVGCFPLNNYFSISKDGLVSGYGAEYTNAIAQVANWNVEYVKYDNWNEALDALGRGDIDLLSPAQHTEERDAVFGFSAYPIGTESGALFALKSNDSFAYEDYEAINGKEVGVVGSVVFLDGFKNLLVQKGISVDFSYYRDTSSLISALTSGEVDAIMGNSMIATSDMKQLFSFGEAPIYYMVSPKAANLTDSLDSAMANIKQNYPTFQEDLSKTFFGNTQNTTMSKEEMEYARNSGTLKVACPARYVPLSYMDSSTGKMDGVDVALLNRVAEISGLSFEYVPVPVGDDIIEYAMKNDIPLVANIERDEKMPTSGEIMLTNPYIEITKVFMGHEGDTFETNTPKTVAIAISSDSSVAALENAYPLFKFVQYSSAEECIDAVRRGSADYVLYNRSSIENELLKPQNADFSVLLTKGVPVEVCCGITENNQVLESIMNKVIAQISSQEAETHLVQYAQKTKYEYSFLDFIYRYRFPLGGVSLALLVAVVALVVMQRTRYKAQKDIAENELKLRRISNNINGGVVVLVADEGVRITYANDGFLEMVGIDRETFEKSGSSSYTAYVHPDDLPIIHQAVEDKKTEYSLELRILRTDGSYIPALFNCTVGEDLHGLRQLYCVIIDMTEQRKLLDRLRIEKKRTELILGCVQEVFYEVNLFTHTITSSPSFSQKFGWAFPASWEKDSPKTLTNMWNLHPDDKEKMVESTREMLAAQEKKTFTARMLANEEGNYLWCEVTQYPILAANGSVASVIGLITDVDAEVRERESLRERAMRDSLTGLYNKEAFRERVQELLNEQPSLNHAIVFIDLDGFKGVNDTLGHLMGDQAICDAAAKLQVIFSHYDIIARFGGDEFCVFVRNIPTETLVGKMDWLLGKLRAEYVGENGVAHVTCSCGVACTATDGSSFDELVSKADKALYYSKEHGRNVYTFYSRMPKSQK